MAGHRLCQLLLIGCFAWSCDSGRSEPRSQPEAASTLIQLLSRGQPVFGIFSGEHTESQAAMIAGNRETDFVFYSLETGPFDIPAMETYIRAMSQASGELAPHPVALRIPPARDGAAETMVRVRQGLDAGVASIVFPHVESAAEAKLAVRSMGPGLWPANPDGRLLAMLIIEDRSGVARAREIASVPGVSVVFAGPGDLRRAYQGDMEAVEQGIQTVLAACKEFAVPCGITAGVQDIAARLEQGFKVIIVTQPEALVVGRQVAGRSPP